MPLYKIILMLTMNMYDSESTYFDVKSAVSRTNVI